MTLILGIDPGTQESAWVIYHAETKAPIHDGFAKQANQKVKSMLFDRGRMADVLAVEMVKSYGMPVGDETFETCLWIGRFLETWDWTGAHEQHLIPRKTCVAHLCGTAKATDSNVLHAIYDLYGGSRRAAVGVKAEPGPLYGMKGDVFQALAVAITCAETRLGAA